ncbi:DUF6261 family protein [Draconibacterium mangrovi]|uniref:DUF6261 family protein n=1 Tax=Draconibacterium mangrovi TaxID=2697469 RepID=UPI0013D79F8B|nr:DUF6261 family protein [Draconibacterium mangrovi]
MEILNARLHDFRNEEHKNFHTEVNDLIIRFTVEALKIQRYYPAFSAALDAEAEALDVVQKSMFTGPIADADHIRDTTTLGMEDMVDAALRHFNPDVRAAARRLKIVFDSFKGITTKPYDAQTAATDVLLTQLQTTYRTDMQTVGLTDWATELAANNQALKNLVGERYTDETGKPPQNMKEARKQLDAAYRNVAKLVDCLMFVEGPEAYEAFVAELNERIDKYNTNLSLRDGRNAEEEE